MQLTVKAGKEGTSGCGLVVNFGDGAVEQFKVNVDDVKLPLSIDHAYKKPGKYSIKVSGKKITTHHSCKGGASAMITVSPANKRAKAVKPKN